MLLSSGLDYEIVSGKHDGQGLSLYRGEENQSGDRTAILAKMNVNGVGIPTPAIGRVPRKKKAGN